MSEPEDKKIKGKTSWINTILELLKESDSEIGKTIIEGCERKCFEESDILTKAKEISSRTEGFAVQEVLDIVQKDIFDKEENSPKIHMHDGVIYLEYTQCRCPLETSQNEYDEFLCECTKGFAKSLAETLFNQSADVTILKTIVRGDDSCLLAIRLI